MAQNGDNAADLDPAAVYAMVGRLVRRLSPRACNVRIAFDTPGGVGGVLPVELPPDQEDEESLDQRILGVVARLKPGDRLRAKTIAVEVERDNDSYFRSVLARMAKRGLLVKDDNGYGPPPQGMSGGT